MFRADIVLALFSLLYSTTALGFFIYFQMRPVIKKDVFHLNWAPESLPADQVKMYFTSVC